MLVHPSFIELMAEAAQGEHVEFAPYPGDGGEIHLYRDPGAGDDMVPLLYRTLVDRITPAVTKNFLADADCAGLPPLSILLIGPLGIWIGSAISGAGLYDPQLPRLAVGGDYGRPVAAAGDDRRHRVFTPTIIQTIAETGKRAW